MGAHVKKKELYGAGRFNLEKSNIVNDHYSGHGGRKLEMHFCGIVVIEYNDKKLNFRGWVGLRTWVQ